MSIKKMKVEDLIQFRNIIIVSKEDIRKQEKIIFRLLRYEIGIVACITVKINIRAKIRKIKKQFPAEIDKTRKIGQNVDKQLVLIAALFFILANIRGYSFAENFINKLMPKIAPINISSVYQLSKLVQCEGDIFNNYIKYNRVLFTELNSIGACKNIILQETSNLQEIKILSCFIIKFFHAVGCEEIATSACELFMAGYSLIEEATQSKYCRFCTLAEDGNCCLLQFHRKGTN